MKNIFKTALSVILALAVILVPMTVMAATGDSEEPWQLIVANGPMDRLPVTVEPLGTQWVQAADMNGTVEVGYATGNYMLMYGRMPVYPETESGNYTATLQLQGYDIFSIYNPSETDSVTVYMTLAAGSSVDTTGTMDNPEVLELADTYGMGVLSAISTKELAAGNEGYYYTVTAPDDGAVAISIGAVDAEWNPVGWMYNANNITAGKYGDTHFSDDDPIVDTEFVPVSKDDEITIFATTYNPENMWNAPAGTLNVYVSFITVGDYSYPDTPVIGANTAIGGNGYNYAWEAPEDGTVTVTMDSASWQYQLNVIPADEEDYSSYVYGDTHFSDGDPVVASESVEIAAGCKINLMINTYDPNSWVAPEGTVNWTFSFVPGEISGGDIGGGDIGGGDIGGGDIGGGDEDVNYVESLDPIIVGTETYDASMMYAYTVYNFSPEETGKYTFSSADKLGIVGYNWVNGNPSDETVNANEFVWECTAVGQGIYIAVLPETNVTTITVEREDLDTENEYDVIVYENVALTEEATLDGDQANVEYIDTTDDKEDKVILGEDGFYHLNTADGPVVFINLNDKETLSIIDMLLHTSITAVYYNDDDSVKEVYDFTDAILEYLGSDDLDALGEIGNNEVLFPLTADLMKIYQMVGETSGWYGENGFVGGELDDAWMFACCYNEDITVWGNASTGDSNSGSSSNETTGSTSSDNTGNKEVDKSETSPVTGDSAIALAVAMAAAAVLVIKTKKIAE